MPTADRHEVRPVAFSPDGAALAAVGRGVRVYDPRAATLVAAWPTRDGPHLVAWAGPGRRLAACLGRKAAALDLDTGAAEEWPANLASWQRAAFRPDGRAAVTFDYDDRAVAGWDLTAGGPECRWRAAPPAAADWLGGPFAYLPDGGRVVGLEYSPGGARPTYHLTVRAAADGAVLDRVPYRGRYPSQLVPSPDGAALVGLVGSGSTLLVWATADLRRKPVQVANTSRQFFTGAAFHPAGRYLAATSNDATVKLYDTATWAVARTYTWAVGRMRSVAFSPDGTLAAAGSDADKVVVWDVDG